MHDHSFKNEHGRFPVTTDVLQNIQHDIQMLSKAIAGMGGDAAIFTKGGDVAAVDGEVVESHGSGKCIEKLMDSKNFAVQGEIYDVLETTGYLNDNYGKMHSNMFDLPTQINGLRSSIDTVSSQLSTNVQQIINRENALQSNLESKVNELRNQMAQSVAQLNNQLAQSVAQLNSQIANIEKHTVPKGALMLMARDASYVDNWCIEKGWVSSDYISEERKRDLANFWGDKISFETFSSAHFSTKKYRVLMCNGFPFEPFINSIFRDIRNNDFVLYIKCL